MSKDTTAQRFWRKVEVSPDGCWMWTASTHGGGYGRIGIGGGRQIGAHRYAYELLVGPIPDGLDLDHLCRNRACVNPDHLEPVTRRENLLRGNTEAARRAARTHCPKGHPLSGDNLRVDKHGHRSCRTCHLEAGVRFRARRKAGATIEMEVA